MTVQVSDATPNVGETITYTLTGAPAFTASTTVTITSVLPSGVTFVSATPSKGTYDSAHGTWNVGTLNGASVITLTVKATVNAGTDGQTITSAPTINYVQSSCTQSSAVAGVSITVQAASNPSPVTGSISVCKVLLNASGTIVDGSAISGQTFTVPGFIPSPSSTASSSAGLLPTTQFTSPLSLNTKLFGSSWDNAQCVTYSNLAIGHWYYGQEVITTSSTLFSVPKYNDQLDGIATSTSDFFLYSPQLYDNNPNNDGQRNYNSDGDIELTNAVPNRQLIVLNQYLAPATNTITYADIAITKTADVATTTEGGTIHYTLTATAIGPAASTGVVATDTLPSGLNFVSATTSMGTYNSSTGAWNVGTMSASSTATLVITATAKTGTANSTITNSAVIGESSIDTDQNLGNNSSSVSVWVEPNPVTAPGSISVCKVMVDASGTIIDGSAISGETFTVPGFIPSASSTAGPAAGLLPTSAFTTPLSLNTKLFGSSWNNAQCVTYSNLAIGHWYYGQEQIATSSGIWATPKYNDQDTGIASSTSDFYLYSPQLYDNNPSNDGQRNYDSDGDIQLTTSTPVRQLIVLNQFLGQATTTLPSADISIVKTANVTSTTEGGTIDYTLSVSANGPATSTGVVATDILPSGLTFQNATASVGTYASSTGTWTIGTLPASSTATLLIDTTANSGTAGTTINNTGTVTESTSTIDQNLGNNSSTVSVSVAPNVCTSNCGGGGGTDADISIVKTANVATTTEGGTIDYTLTVTALGPDASPAVVATDTLPSGLTFVSATSSVGTYSSSTGTWTIGNMAANATATLEIAATANVGTANSTITNVAVVGEGPGVTDTNPGNNTSSVPVTVEPNNGVTTADIAISKTVDNSNPNVGDTVTYTVTVSDLGPDASNIVDVTDQMPAGITFASATTSVGTYNMTSGDWPIGTLAPNATATLVLSAVVNSGTAGQTISNTATVTQLSSIVDPNPANNSSTVSITVQQPACTSNCGGGGGGTTGGGGGASTANIGIVKTVDNADPAPGATIHYTLTAQGLGPSASIGAVASDTLPAGVTFVSASSSVGSYNSATGLWTIGTLNAGTSQTLVITATVDASDPIGETITNTGTISESPSVVDENTTTNTSSVTITVGGSNGGGGNTGGGGGGSVSVGGGGGGTGGGGGSTGTGSVLGANTCGLYLTQYIHPIRKDLNDPNEVIKLQSFLNQNLGLNIPLTGYYGNETIAAVNQFQVKYHIEVLQPWVPYGLPTQFTPTEYVYKTTQRWINLIECSSLNLPIPQLP